MYFQPEFPMQAYCSNQNDYNQFDEAFLQNLEAQKSEYGYLLDSGTCKNIRV